MAKASPITSCKKETSVKIELIDAKLESPDSCLYPLETYKCNTCHFRTNFLLHLRNHLVVHTSRPKQKCKFLSYVCQKCNFSTHSILVLSKHVSDLCSNALWYFCDRCNFKTYRNEYLRRHKKNKHTADKDVRWFQCKFCAHHTRWKGNLKEHVLSRHSKKLLKAYKCGICEFKTKWKNALKRHKLERHSHNTKPVWLKCPDCDYHTLRRDSLKRHGMSVHANDEQAPRFKCKICYFETRRRDLLARHSQQVHGLLLPKPKPKSPNKIKLDPPKLTMNNFGLQFEVAPKAGANFVTIQPNSHVVESLPQEKWFSCDRCPFSAKLQSSLKIHQLSHQRKSRTVYFKCGLCPLQSDRKDNLQRHIRETHMEWDLNEGTLVKTGVLDKKYCCDSCPFTTEWNNSLDVHKRLMHREGTLR